MKSIASLAVMFALVPICVLGVTVSRSHRITDSAHTVLGNDASGDPSQRFDLNGTPLCSGNGQLFLGAIRASSHECPLDLRRYDVGVTPPAEGRTIQDMVPFAATDHADDVFWKAGPGIPGVFRVVLALGVYNDGLIAAGDHPRAP